MTLKGMHLLWEAVTISNSRIVNDEAAVVIGLWIVSGIGTLIGG